MWHEYIENCSPVAHKAALSSFLQLQTAGSVAIEAIELKTSGEDIGLLNLPLELRRVIILSVLNHRRPKKPPVLKQRVVDGRVRLRNCFDPNYPDETNIHVEKERNVRIHGNGLLRTCRLLRRDTLDLIADTLETGKVKIPFVLDIMLVKGIGFLPTWMSFPIPRSRFESSALMCAYSSPAKGLYHLTGFVPRSTERTTTAGARPPLYGTCGLYSSSMQWGDF